MNNSESKKKAPPVPLGTREALYSSSISAVCLEGKSDS